MSITLNPDPLHFRKIDATIANVIDELRPSSHRVANRSFYRAILHILLGIGALRGYYCEETAGLI